MESEIKKVLLKFKGELKNNLKEKFIDLILFGSHARGDYSKDSDIDVLLLTSKNLTKEEKGTISEMRTDMFLKYGIVISYFNYPIKIYEKFRSPFLLNVKKEGVRI